MNFAYKGFPNLQHELMKTMFEKIKTAALLLVTACAATVTFSPQRAAASSRNCSDAQYVAPIGAVGEKKPDVPPLTCRVGTSTFELVYVKGGTFRMGEVGGKAFANATPHEVSVNDFLVGKTEVTQELWESVMGQNPSREKGALLPVSSVSWNDCVEFLKKLNRATGRTFRFLTEAEWEYAARSSAAGIARSGKYANELDSYAWFAGNAAKEGQKKPQAHRVGLKREAAGLFDMLGNVAEWCFDYYGDYNAELTDNPIGPTMGGFHVCRGGSYADKAELLNESLRAYYHSDKRLPTVGLRLAEDVTPVRRAAGQALLRRSARLRGDWNEFLLKNLVYPERAVREKTEGTVELEFVVEDDGSVKYVDVWHSVSEECDAEAVRVVRLTQWFPAEDVQGRPAACLKKAKIRFNLK